MSELRGWEITLFPVDALELVLTTKSNQRRLLMAQVQYFDEQVETMPKEKLKAFQFGKLQDLLRKVYASNIFYQTKYKKAGVKLSDLKSLDDLRKLPFTVKKEFEADQTDYRFSAGT